MEAASTSGSSGNGACRGRRGRRPARREGSARRMDIVDLDAGFGERHDHRRHQPAVEPNAVTALIGPSGCGKSTLLRCLNAMHRPRRARSPNGEILLDGVDINARGVDPVLVRRRVGMVFQRPNPFPTMSIYDNVAAGLRLTSGRRGRRHRFDEAVERALRQADLGPRSRIACAHGRRASRAASSSASASRARSRSSPRCC